MVMKGNSNLLHRGRTHDNDRVKRKGRRVDEKKKKNDFFYSYILSIRCDRWLPSKNN